MGKIETAQFIEVRGLVREYVLRDRVICNLSGDMAEWDSLETARYREGELALFSPVVEDFYSGRREGWTVSSSFMGLKVDNCMRPLGY